MKREILKLKKKESLYDIALEMGLSEATLYNYLTDYKKISEKSIGKIRRYLKRRSA